MEKVFCRSAVQPPCLFKAKQNSLHVSDIAGCHPVKKIPRRRVWVAPGKYCPQLDGFEAHLSYLGGNLPSILFFNQGSKCDQEITWKPHNKHFSADAHKNEKYYTAKYSMYENVYCNISCLLVEIFLQHVSQVQKINQAFKKRLRMIHLVLS